MEHSIKIKTVERKDFIEYISLHWTDRKWLVDVYLENDNEYSNLGNGIGLYSNNCLIGFLFYKTYENYRDTKFWVLKTKENYPEIIHPDTNVFWENNLLEIHPQYRFKGYGSLLLTNLYNMTPIGSVLVSKSEHTENHISFYKKNLFIQNIKTVSPRVYYFFKTK